MTKPEATWVQSLDHCQIGKHYYYKDETIGKSIFKFQYDGAWFALDNGKSLDVFKSDWRISLEPVPMPEVER